MKLLGIDVGTGGSRALVVDEGGRVVASATVEHEPFASPQTGWAEQDARDWWRASERARGGGRASGGRRVGRPVGAGRGGADVGERGEPVGRVDADVEGFRRPT